jgi:hypothetical protein
LLEKVIVDEFSCFGKISVLTVHTQYLYSIYVLRKQRHVSVKRLKELSAEPEEFGSEDMKPKPFDVPPDLEDNVVEAIGFLENTRMAKNE